jgi:hypothetical protein
MRLGCLPLLALALSASAQSPPRKQILENLRLDGVAEDFPTAPRVFVGPHGQIAVWVSEDQSVRLYDSTGAKIAAFGRRGSGPGESRLANAMGFKADTFWTYDLRAKRLMFVTPAGKLLRHEVLRPELNLGASLDSTREDRRGAMYSFNPIMIAPNGQMIGYAFQVVGRDENGRAKQEQSFLLTDMDGANRRRIGAQARSPMPTQVEVPLDEKRFAVAGIPFLTYPGMVYGTNGTRYAAVTHTFTERGGTYTVIVVKTNGDTVFSRGYPFSGKPIPAAIRDSAIERIRFLKTYEPKIQAALSDLVKPLTPRVYRAVEGLVIGRDNTTWLSMRPEGTTKEVVALNDKGDPILSVRIPANAELKEASLTTLWVVEKDADDLPSIVRYRIK